MKPIALALALLPAPAMAQHDMSTHDTHAMVGHVRPGPLPTEGGQGGFAALAEIVALLRADPDTDWDSVDLDALVAHLRDMERLTTDLVVDAADVPGGARFTVRRDAPGAGAARRMVPAHSAVLAAETGWSSVVEMSGDRLIWTVTDDRATVVIRGLGFFGLMATGNHHPEHHLAIAKGADPHMH